MDQIRSLCTFHWIVLLSLVLVIRAQTPVDKIGIAGESLRLECPDSGTADRVVWSDWIFNTDRNPALIFDSQGNPAMALNIGHRQKDNYNIDEDYTLTILELSDEDYGIVQCEVTKNGEVTLNKMQISVISVPSCNPSIVEVQERSSAEVSCQMAFGSQLVPNMDWYDRNNKRIDSMDASEIRLFIKKIVVSGDVTMNGMTYTCRAGLNDVQRECQTTLSVLFDVQDIEISPRRKEYRVNDLIVCSAAGNPLPTITWFLDGEKIASDKGQSEVVVREEWMYSTKTLTCSAGGTANILNTNITFEALEATTTTTTTSAPPVQAGATSAMSSPGVIIGIVAAVVVILIIIIVVCVRKQNKKPKKEVELELMVPNGSGAKPIPTKDPEAAKLRDMNEKGDENDFILSSGPERRPYSPPPSDPRYNMYYNNNDENGSPWMKLNNHNNHYSPLNRA